MTQPHEIDRRRLLAGISIFEGIESHDMDHLLGITTTRKLAAGEVLFRKGDPGTELYGLMQGRLRVSGEGMDGTEVVFGFLEPGEVFGEVALLGASPRSATVEAVKPGELLCLHRNDFLPFLDRHPAVAVNLAGVLGERLRKLSALMEETLVLTLPARVAMNLAALAHTSGEPGPDAIRFDLRLPRNRLDEFDGPTHQSVHEQIRSWEEEGLLTVERGSLTVRSMEGLEALARFLIV